MKRSRFAKISLAFGCASTTFTVLFYLLTARMAKLPYGDNDFDLILLAIALLDMLLCGFAFAFGILGLTFSGVGLFRPDERFAAIIGASLNLASLFSVSLYFVIEL